MALDSGRTSPQGAMARRLAVVLTSLAAAACGAPDTATAPDVAVSFGMGPPERSVVCHHDLEANTWFALVLPAPAIPAHLGHGDAVPGDRLADDSGIFGPACEEVPDPEPPALPFEVVIDAPSPAAGQYEANGAAFGPLPGSSGVSGTIVPVDDGSSLPTQGCAPIVGFPAGAIALVDRGTCSFVMKVSNAQAAGAVAVVVVNDVPGAPAAMGGVAPGVVIPSVIVSLADGATIKAGLPATGTVRARP